MDWQELLIGKQARVTPLGLAYDCPMHVSTPGTLHGITLDTYAPVYFCTVCHRAFPAREMATLLRLKPELPPEEPITNWLWRVRGSHPTPYWKEEPIRPPLAKHAISARDLVAALDRLQAAPDQHRKITDFLFGCARGAVVLVHTAGYDGIATSLTLARPNRNARWPKLSLRTGITGFLPSVTFGGATVFVPTVQMIIAPSLDLAELAIAGSPRFTHADGGLSLAVDWKGPAACAITRTDLRGRRGAATIMVVGRTPLRRRHRPVLLGIIAWMCAVAVAKAVGAPVRLRITLPKRVADILVDNFGWYQAMVEQLGLAILRDKYTRLVVTIGAKHDTSSQELHMDLGRTLLKYMAMTVWPPQAPKLRKAIDTAAAHVRTKDTELPELRHTDPGKFLLGLIASLASDPRNNSSVKYKPTAYEHSALLALSTSQTEPPQELTCAS